MPKRSGVFDVQVDVSKLISGGKQEKQSECSLMTLEKVMRNCEADAGKWL